MAGKDGDKQEYTIKDVGHDLRLIAKTVNTLRTRSEVMEKRLEVVEAVAGEEDQDFDEKDRRKALSRLADNVINPDEHMLPQMTETPDSMIMPMVVEHAKNEFLKLRIKNPNTDVLFSDLLMKWFNIVMRSRHRGLIGEAMGFSQIEMDKAMDEEERKIALEE